MPSKLVTDMIKKLANGTYTAGELDAFLKELEETDTPSYIKVYNELYQEVIKLPPGETDVRFVLEMEKKLDALETRLNDDTDTIPFTGRPLMRFAAAALFTLAVAGSIWLFINKSGSIPSKSSMIARHDVAPGKDHAVLTLANGQQIILDSSANGVISNQGGTTVINLKGKITYDGQQAAGSEEILYNTIETQRGNQYQLILPDGTKVWLNAASSLRYPTSFSGTRRNVALTGEAYFEIAKDSKNPFTVSFNQTEVKVLGTEFNVMAYSNEPAGTQTTLVNGSIAVREGSQEVQLEPGKMAVINNNHLKVRRADIEQVTAWKNGDISLSNTDLPTLIRQISRWYDVDITFEGEIPSRHFMGVINRNVYLSTLLDFLKENRIKNRMEGRNIILSSY